MDEQRFQQWWYAGGRNLGLKEPVARQVWDHVWEAAVKSQPHKATEAALRTRIEELGALYNEAMSKIKNHTCMPPPATPQPEPTARHSSDAPSFMRYLTTFRWR